MIGRTTSFVGHFDGRLGLDVRCCPYHKLTPLSNGCPYYCTYCYLAFVYRKYSPYIKLNINYQTMFSQITRAAARTSNRVHFNMGEMLDSLALDHITNLTAKLIPFIITLPNTYLMLLTKSANIDNLLIVKSNHQTVISWSINPPYVSERFEPATASFDERIVAAQRCQSHGYRIRFRIDPGILYDNWRSGYSEIIAKTLTSTDPENITLGTLRLLPGHIALAQQAYGRRGKELARHSFGDKPSNHKIHYSIQECIEFYSFLVDQIRCHNSKVPISLCRESPQVWQALADRCLPNKCNCLTW